MVQLYRPLSTFIICVFLCTSYVYCQNSLNMNLLGIFDYPVTQGNDIWGWVDSNENEYALVGLRNGFSVVNVTNPTNPYEVFFISDINSIWRDVKTWGNYAYVTTEAHAGLLIVDLTDTTGSTYWHLTSFTNPNDGDSVTFTRAHNIYIDEFGVAYIFGASTNIGNSPTNGAIFLDVAANPTDPVYLGEWDDYYIHDGMVRGDTLYAGCIYEGELYVVDVSDKSNPQVLGHKATPSNFTHNAWVSDNGQFVFTTDEQSDAYIAAYDISNISNIQEVDRIQSNPGSNSIPHNTHVDGNFLITSYYRDGTTVHDITYPNNMIEVAYYDSYSGSGDGFDGCWGTYPYLPSGNIISSDINSANGQGRLLIYGRAFMQACHLQGYVYDGITGLTIANANIDIVNTTTSEVTNLIGFYQMAVLDSGSYQMVVSASGYESDTLSVILNNGVMSIQDIYLYPPCSTLSITSSQSITLCFGDNMVVGNSVYTNSGTYIDTLSNSFGCDSIITTYLTFNPSNTYYQSFDICNGDNIIVGSSVYNISNTYYDTLTNIYMCDSIVITELNVFDPTGIITFNPPYMTIVANGGMQPYNYDISLPNGTNQIVNNQNGNYNFIPTLSGLYSFIATDSYGCTSSMVYYNVENPSAILESLKERKINKVVNYLGQETILQTNMPLYIFLDDGSVESIMIID